MASFADHFSALAARYAAYRPRYPRELVTVLADRCQRHDIAWDIGCGSGQLSVALAARFYRVIATDPAQAQLAHAEQAPRVEYRCVTAEDSGLPDASVELAVAAQSAHWFDWPGFVVEAARVVRAGGLIALVTYRNVEIGGEVGRVLADYYHQIEPYWPNGRVHVNNRYRDLAFPWPAAPAPELEMAAQWTRDELYGYITTWTATARCIEANGEGPLAELHRRLEGAWPDGEARKVWWPLTLKLTRRP